MNNDYLGPRKRPVLRSRIVRTVTGQKPQGGSIEPTLDPVVQQAACGCARRATRARSSRSSPKTGRILAMVSKPSFDPNLLARRTTPIRSRDYDQLLADPTQPLFNRAIGGDLNPPGSTFKLVVAAAALENGTVHAESTFANPATLPLPQSSAVMQNASRTTCGPGTTVSLTQAMIFSCNIPFAELAMSIGSRRDPRRRWREVRLQPARCPSPSSSTPSVYPRAPLDERADRARVLRPVDVRSHPTADGHGLCGHRQRRAW